MRGGSEVEDKMTVRYITLIAVLAASPAVAADPLPAYAYDDVAVITLATTAGAACTNMTADDTRLKVFVAEMYGKLIKDGIQPADAVAAFQTERATAELGKREAAFRSKYKLGSKNDAAFCAAVVTEAQADPGLGRVLTVSP